MYLYLTGADLFTTTVPRAHMTEIELQQVLPSCGGE